MKSATLSPEQRKEIYSGVNPVTGAALIESIVTDKSSPALSVVFVRNLKEAEQWAEDIEFFATTQKRKLKVEARVLPMLPERPEDEPRAFDMECDRLTALTRLNDFREGHTKADERLVLLTTPRSFFQAVPERKELAAKEVRIRVGDELSFRGLIEKLGDELGYDSEVVCETPGQFAIRGGLVDVYPINAEEPYRIDFFGDEIDGIRAFDPTTQRSLLRVEQLSITALNQSRSGEKKQYLFDYLPDSIGWVFHEPGTLAEENPALFTYPERIRSLEPGLKELFDRRLAFPDVWISLKEFETEDDVFGADITHRLYTESLEPYRTFVADEVFGVDRVTIEQEARKNFFREMLRWQKNGFRLHIVFHSDGEEERLREILKEDPAFKDIRFVGLRGNLNKGFRISLSAQSPVLRWKLDKGTQGVAVITDSEIFGRYKVRTVARKRKMPTRSQVDQLLDFSELADGDHLVHLQHGICRFRGLSLMDLNGRKEEMISVEFAENIKLHVPLHESHLLTRYVGLTKSRPKLGKVGSNQWEKTRHAAEKATLDFAADMLKMQAQRDVGKGFAFSPDHHWQKEFESSFRYKETPDQLRSIEETKQDMESPKPMDRLLCGDVGFGKTEVALRAAFKAVMDGKQVALLVPTTILAQQHFTTFRERMADYPVVVEMLSRFRTKQQQDQIVNQLKQGKIDIVIGTHRLVSKDVEFKDLGLLIIDEEHRFGVRHKEKIKKLRQTVDVLMMSATPIPRTLYMALMGARDLSVIETPPTDRLPIHTVVKNYSLETVRDAILFEVERGGQVFYLHNRVNSIASVADRLRELLPDLRIGVGHGQMEERQLEKVMSDFVDGQYDVFVCTTIIETGLDIPNCNTIIIEGADRFGLSQLYQLRGRVGRFKRQAYAYLLLHRHAQMLDQARKRLSALKQYNQLGAGFKIAMRDLELRGAGNLLGAQQSGHIAGVGFELYCQLLKQSISGLKGEKIASRIRASLRLDFVAVGEGALIENEQFKVGFGALKEDELSDQKIDVIEANLPVSYIGETRLRIDFYRKLSMSDSLESLREIEQSLVDRFGKYPDAVKALVLLTEIRILAEQKQIQYVETEGSKLKLRRALGRNKTEYIKIGSRFPRLNAKKPFLRLQEIITFLKTRIEQRS